MNTNRQRDTSVMHAGHDSLDCEMPLGRKQFLFSLLASVLTLCLSKIGRHHLRAGRPQAAVFAFDHIGHEININGAYESYELDAVIHWLTRHKLIRGSFVDIGANIGNHSLFFAKYYERVLSFEPNPRTFGLLTFNASLSNNIECFNFGLSDRDGHARMIQGSDNVGESRVVIGEFLDLSADVLLRSLDGVTECSNRSVGLIKIDVEGHELQVLKGSVATILKNMPVILFEHKAENFSEGSSPVIDLLRSLNYQQFARVGSYPRLSASIPSVLRILGTSVLRIVAGFGFRVQQIATIEPLDYSMIIAIPPHQKP